MNIIGQASVRGGFMCLVLALSVSAARAGDDEPAKPAVDKSQFTLFNPTPTDDLRSFSPDRPAKVASPYTVDAGRIQIESDFGSYTHTNYQGLTTRTFQALDPVLKLGVLNNVDLEMSLNGYDRVHQGTNGVAGSGVAFAGFGDVFFRAKINLLGNDGGNYTFALIPYLKVPSATPASLAIGNDAVEGGGQAVLQITLPQDFALTLQTEGDALKGGADSRRHANFVNIINLTHPVPGIKDLTAIAEFASSVSVDRFTPAQYTADVAFAYLVNPTTQLDVGANFGLNKAAPDVQIYGGVAKRF